ncbi:hypothetical protein DPEC_G00355870 [Dallia pectoralis]|uniref:Uncharacterized protein n=1 Tax=Dallia pectoralis TaxID=75939 RepID=A0ACC2EZN5_DALPE|nr:hypothetical protein DPEC_G00355870 [Dallia pectoralis]
MEEETSPDVIIRVRRKKFTWSEQQTLQFINLRMEHDAQFTGHRKASAYGFGVVIKEMGLANSITNVQAAKKWENLKKKYKDLILRAGTDGGEVTAANWPFFAAMHTALQLRDSIRPLNIISTAVDSDDEEPDEVASTSAPDPSTTLYLPEGSKNTKPKKRKNEVLEYLKVYTERQEKRQREMDEREEERERKKMEQMDKLIAIFGKLVEKQ